VAWEGFRPCRGGIPGLLELKLEFKLLLLLSLLFLLEFELVCRAAVRSCRCCTKRPAVRGEEEGEAADGRNKPTSLEDSSPPLLTKRLLAHCHTRLETFLPLMT